LYWLPYSLSQEQELGFLLWRLIGTYKESITKFFHKPAGEAGGDRFREDCFDIKIENYVAPQNDQESVRCRLALYLSKVC
jgi:hypothetical protein